MKSYHEMIELLRMQREVFLQDAKAALACVQETGNVLAMQVYERDMQRVNVIDDKLQEIHELMSGDSESIITDSKYHQTIQEGKRRFRLIQGGLT